jgi:hypothetical protein
LLCRALIRLTKAGLAQYDENCGTTSSNPSSSSRESGPHTVAGKILGGVTSIAGIGLIAMPTGILAAAFSAVFQRTRIMREGDAIGVNRSATPKPLVSLDSLHLD